MAQQANRFVDLAFGLQGTTIPADHGYALYAAISRRIPAIHAADDVGIHPILGLSAGHRQLALTPKSHLTFRLPAHKIPAVLLLAGQRLVLDGFSVAVGVPAARPLVPASTLVSRLVTIRGFTESEPFLEAVRRQAAGLSTQAQPALVLRRRITPVDQGTGGTDPYLRRTLRIAGREVVGYAVLVAGLDPAESVRLQEQGLGGRRRFGCGVFVAARD